EGRKNTRNRLSTGRTMQSRRKADRNFRGIQQPAGRRTPSRQKAVFPAASTASHVDAHHARSAGHGRAKTFQIVVVGLVCVDVVDAEAVLELLRGEAAARRRAVADFLLLALPVPVALSVSVPVALILAET